MPESMRPREDLITTLASWKTSRIDDVLTDAMDAIGGCMGTDFLKVWEKYHHGPERGWTTRSLGLAKNDREIIRMIWARRLNNMRQTISEEPPHHDANTVLEIIQNQPRRLSKRKQRIVRQTRKEVRQVQNRLESRHMPGMRSEQNFVQYYGLKPLRDFLEALQQGEPQKAAAIACDFCEDDLGNDENGGTCLYSKWMQDAWAKKQGRSGK